MERFLYRLAKSKYAARFILKGALMLRVWQSPESRPTMDIDLLGITSNDEAEITGQIREILSIEVEPDVLHFDATSIRVERITEDAEYQGLRVRFRGILGTAKINRIFLEPLIGTVRSGGTPFSKWTAGGSWRDI
jgi:Nucleotidyl transferase AbiEii toxin, Type IV TA system